jgi:hypothetical protein
MAHCVAGVAGGAKNFGAEIVDAKLLEIISRE